MVLDISIPLMVLMSRQSYSRRVGINLEVPKTGLFLKIEIIQTNELQDSVIMIETEHSMLIRE